MQEGANDGMKTLTPKRQAFCREYIKDFNATKAAERTGYSKKTARAAGCFLLTIPDIQADIKRLIAERAMTEDEIILRLADHARSDMGEFLDIGSMTYQLDLKKAKELGLTHLIKKVKQRTTTIVHKDGEEEEHTTIEIELYDAQAALVALGKVHAMFTDKVKVEDGWRTEIIALLKSGAISAQDVQEEMGDDSLAAELFREAGVSVENENDL